MPDLAAMPDVAHWAERGAFGPFDGGGLRAPTQPYRAAFGGGQPRLSLGASGPDAPFAA
jgi:hypothetical protein